MSLKASTPTADQGTLRMDRLGNSLVSLILGKLERLLCLPHAFFFTSISVWVSITLQPITLTPENFLQALVTRCCCCFVVMSYLTLLQPHGLYSPPGSSVHGISQARILEWVAISFSSLRSPFFPSPRSFILIAESYVSSVISDPL